MNRRWEAQDKIARRKCWRKCGSESQEEIAGGNCEKKALGKIARRKCWRKLLEGIAGGIARRIAGGKRWRKSLEKIARIAGGNRRKLTAGGNHSRGAGGIAGMDRWRKSRDKIAGEK